MVETHASICMKTGLRKNTTRTGNHLAHDVSRALIKLLLIVQKTPKSALLILHTSPTRDP